MSSDFKNMEVSMRSLNTIKMNAIKTAEGGIVNHETIFRFRQGMSPVLAGCMF